MLSAAERRQMTMFGFTVWSFMCHVRTSKSHICFSSLTNQAKPYIKRNIQRDCDDHSHTKINPNSEASLSLDHALTYINHKNAL